jgi:glutamine synthetase
MASTIQQFLKEHGISEVEAIIPDMAGVARGKLMPAEKFAEEEGMRLPEAIFLQTVTGDYPDDQSAMNPSDIDIVLKADPSTVRVVPWAAEPTAQVIHDCFYGDGRPVTMAPRYVLRRVLELYQEQGWEPVVAPELEFFLVEPNIDSDYPLKPPVGRSGRPEIGRQAYSIAAVNEFDPLFDDMYSFCEAPTRPSSSSARRARPPCGTRCMPRSWRSRWPRSRAAPCICTRASWMRRLAKTYSATPTARPRPCSSATSPACRSIYRARCRCSRPT